jgi:stage IV sporulation protein FB
MLRNGFLSLGHWRAAPIRLHWSMPLGAVLFSGFSFRPVFWLGFVLLVLLHELGHAVVVAHAGARVTAIHLTALGGECHWSGTVSPLQRACIAWGGVWAQALGVVAALLVVAVQGMPMERAGLDLFQVFTFTSAYTAAFNLLPIRPLDGAEAWPLFGILWRRHRARVAARLAATRTMQVRARLAQLEAAEQGEVPLAARETVAQFLSDVRREPER